MPGISYEVTTFGGRTCDEPRLFVALAAALAHACHGYVIVMHDLYDVAVGIYDAETFRHVTPKFR